MSVLQGEGVRAVPERDGTFLCPGAEVLSTLDSMSEVSGQSTSGGFVHEVSVS